MNMSRWKRLAAGAFALTTSLSMGSLAHADALPVEGGTLEIGTVNRGLPVLTWDPADWNWKTNHDTGQFYEQLFSADLTKSRRNGGIHPFYADAWLPTDAMRGELAERWEFKQDPLRLIVYLRKGIMFPEKPGVMKSREFVADDVIYTYNRLDKSPKRINTYFDYVEKVEATDKHTVVFTLKSFNAEWAYRFGYGYFSSIYPKEVVEAGPTNWKNVNGTGPFMLTDHVQSNQNTYSKNPIYWDTEKIGGKDYKLPFLDKLIYRNIKDEATALTALRTGKLDILEPIRWSDYETTKKSNPQLKWSKWLSMNGQFVSMRVDTKPFDDVRVRRALNMAVNKQEIVASYYGGHAELFSYPQHPDYVGYFEPLDKMPASVKELFIYDPDKAKKILAEAGPSQWFHFQGSGLCLCA